MSTLAKVAGLTRPYWPRILLGILLSLMVSGITAAIAWLVKPALDDILVGKKYHYLKLLPFGVFLLFSAKGLLTFGQTYLMKSAGMKLVREMRNRLYDHMLGLPLGYFSREASGTIVSRIMLDVEALNGLVSDVIKTFVVEIPTVIFLLGIALYRSWSLTLMSLILFPLIVYSARRFGKGVKKRRREAQRNLSFLTHRIGESVFGARIIKVFNQEKTMGSKFRNDNQKYYRQVMRVVRLKESTKLLIDMVTGMGIAVVLWYGGSMIIAGSITPGIFASILVAVYMMFSPMKKIGEAYNAWQEARASLERIEVLQNTEHEAAGNRIVEGFRHSLKFENVSFGFPGTELPVLRDINLEIKQGEIIAIVGRSGVGKSTLVDLIPKFHLVSSGRITLDGTDLRELETISLRNQIGIVSQDIILFNDTIRENILFGKRDASDSDIIRAAGVAYADEFIEKLPEKYETLVGDRGQKLSGGQRQRVAIARAVLKNPPILILDEATSALDSVSETLVQKALDALMTGRTTIVIAHRLSTIRNADRIVIIEGGRISAMGSHDELIAGNPAYQELYRAFS
jgi:ATP-binding cassette, subfamily B, bacterial MsbA